MPKTVLSREGDSGQPFKPGLVEVLFDGGALWQRRGSLPSKRLDLSEI